MARFEHVFDSDATTLVAEAAVEQVLSMLAFRLPTGTASPTVEA